MPASDVWQVFLFLVLPLLACYVGLMVWSCKRDRWKR
jgi:cytochrome oxidase assembly protein ShyY1